MFTSIAAVAVGSGEYGLRMDDEQLHQEGIIHTDARRGKVVHHHLRASR